MSSCMDETLSSIPVTNLSLRKQPSRWVLDRIQSHSKIEFKIKKSPIVLYFSFYNKIKMSLFYI